MKRLKFLPSILMLVACIAVLCVGVLSLTPTENVIGGTVNISSMSRVSLTGYVNEKVAFLAEKTAYGVSWDLTESGALNFDVGKYSTADEVPLRTIRIHIENLTELPLGAYFYNGNETTLQTIDGEKYATYDSLKLTDVMYKRGADKTAENKLADVTLSPYTYIAPSDGAAGGYDELDMFINIDITNIGTSSFIGDFNYLLRIEQYQPNLSSAETSVASGEQLEIRTAAAASSGLNLIKLEPSTNVTEVPVLLNASYGCIVIPTTYTTIPASGLTACTGLTSIAIPQSITSVGASALNGCSALKALDWHANSVSSFNSSNQQLSNTIKILNIASYVTQTPMYMAYNNTGLRRVHFSYGLARISGGAFYGCTSLNGVVVPDSVTSIIEAAFYECSALSNIDVGKGINSIQPNVFSYCTSLTSYTVPRNVVYILDGAFSHCTNLKSVLFHKDFKSLWNSEVFAGCDALEQIVVEEANTTYRSVDNCLIKLSNKQLVLGCKTSVIPSDGSVLSVNGFAGCTALTSITIPGSVTLISGFNDCTNLTSVTLNNGLQEIDKNTFKNCIKLTSIVIPTSVTKMGVGTFSGCTHLQSITNPVFLSDMSQFNYALSIGDLFIQGFSDIMGANNYRVPESLTTVTLYAGVKDNEFTRCPGLKEVMILPTNSASIGSNAFSQCYNLESVVIGRNVTEISGGAFISCPLLSEVFFQNVAGWQVNGAPVNVTLSDPSTAATYLKTGSFYQMTKV